jgi:negative regulator of sigma E activity
MKYPIGKLSSPRPKAGRVSNGIPNTGGGSLKIPRNKLGILSRFGTHAIVWLFSTLLVCGLLFGSSEDALSNTPEQFLEVLRRIAASEDEVSYTGSRLITFHTPRGLTVREDLVIHHPPDVNAVKVLSVVGRERFDKHREIERLKDKDRKERRPSRGDRPSSRREFLPRRKRISNLSQAEMQLLAQNYRFHLSPGSAIAGEETNEIKIYPQFEGRPTKRLFISRCNGIILRVEEFDYTGHLQFMGVFTQIEFDREKVEGTLAELKNDKKLIFEKAERRSQPIKDVEAEEALGVRLVQPTYLPPGFQLLETRYIKHRSSTVFLRYTDGLATFSLFERKGEHKSHHPDRGPRRRGGKTISRHDVPIRVMRQHHAHILEWSNSRVDFTLIGELDSSELIKVAESVILASQKEMKKE